MLEIIIIVIIIFAIKNSANKKKNNGMANKRNQSNTTIVSGGAGKKPVTALKQSAAVKKPAAKPENVKEQEVTQGKNESTTDYLERKARMDEIEHKKEMLEQKRAERESYGDLVYAARWMEGDPVTASNKPVICGYCGAGNLVPVHAGMKYHCYFCREEL